MIAGHLFGACLPTFGNCADRYCLSGYGGGGKNMVEMLDLAATVKGLDGLELVGNWHVNDENIRDVARMFQDRGTEDSMLVPDLWTQAKWGRGSMAAPDAKTRQAAMDEVRKVMDWARGTGLPLCGRVARPGWIRLFLPGRLCGSLEMDARGSGGLRESS